MSRAIDDKEAARKARAGTFMEPHQFEALMELAGHHDDSKNRKALALVLLDGYSVREAAQKVETSQGSVNGSMQKVRRVMELVSVLHYPAVRLPPRRVLASKDAGNPVNKLLDELPD